MAEGLDELKTFTTFKTFFRYLNMMKNSCMSNLQPHVMIGSSHIKMTKEILMKECLPYFLCVMINNMINNMINKQSPVLNTVFISLELIINCADY